MGEFHLFIGCKVIKALKYGRKDAYEYFLKRPYTDDGTPDEGYLVEYEDGYMSWSPKDVFERCYRRFSIGESQLVFGKHENGNFTEPPQAS